MLLYSECLPHVSYLARTLQIFWGHLLCSRHQAYKHMSPTRVSRAILHGFKQIEKMSKQERYWIFKAEGNISFRACQPNPLLTSVGGGFHGSVKEPRLHCSRWNQVSLCVHWQDLKRWKGSMASCHWRLKGCFQMPGTNPFSSSKKPTVWRASSSVPGAKFGPSILQLFDPQQRVWVTPGQSPQSLFYLSFEQTCIDFFVVPHIHRLMSLCVIARIINCSYMELSFYFITLLLMTLSRQV